MVQAGRIADVATCYDEGASYVMTPRLLEARDLLDMLDAAGHDLDAEVRRARRESPGDRREVVP